MHFGVSLPTNWNVILLQIMLTSLRGCCVGVMQPLNCCVLCTPGSTSQFTYIEGLDVHSGETEVLILMDLSVVIRYIQQQSSHYSDIASTASSGLVRIRSEQTPEVRHRGQRGRPPFVISLDQLEALIELGLSMRRIASVLGVSERTVRRRREMYGLPIGRDRYSLLLDHELDRLVSDI